MRGMIFKKNGSCYLKLLPRKGRLLVGFAKMTVQDQNNAALVQNDKKRWHGNRTMSRENREQIPSRENEGQTREMENKQSQVQGERKEVDVKDYPKAATVAQVLKDIDFPANKGDIVSRVQQAGPQGQEILSDVQRIEDRQYENIADVTKAAGLVSH
jgi:hypothetical protein